MLRTSEKDVEAALYLAYCLHPEPTWKISASLVAEAFEWAAALEQTQARRPTAEHPYKPVLPDAALFQLGVFQASRDWERDQESAAPQREPVYRPTAEDLLLRYLSFLVARTMVVNARHVAVGLGCHLYRYRPLEISSLAPTLFDEGNIKRVKSRIGRWLNERFSASSRFPLLGSRKPDEGERKLVHQALTAFAPWGVPHLAPNALLLDDYFGDGLSAAEWQRIHLLIDPQCAGLARLIAEYNANLTRNTTMRLDDPDDKLAIPEFGNVAPPRCDDRFTPAHLTARELALLTETVRARFDRNQGRRRHYGAGLVSVRAEGEVICQFDLAEETSRSLPVPLSAAYLEVYGLPENEEELLLAVFPLPEPDAEEPAHFLVRENGWRFELTVDPSPEEDDATNERLVQFVCANRHYREQGKWTHKLFQFNFKSLKPITSNERAAFGLIRYQPPAAEVAMPVKEPWGLVHKALEALAIFSQPKFAAVAATACLALVGLWAALQPPSLQMEWLNEPPDKGFRCYYSADGQPTELRLDFRTGEPGDFLIVLTSDYYKNRSAELHREDSADPERVVARLPLEKHPAATGPAYGEIEVRYTRRLVGRRLPDETIFKGPLPSCAPAAQK